MFSSKPLAWTLAVAALCLPLQTASAATATPDELLKAWVEASGGRAAIEKIKTRSIKGKINLGALGMSGTFEERSKAPNKRVSRTELTGLGTMQEGFDGQVAWSVMPGIGLTEKAGADLARAKRDATFSRELHFKELYERIDTAPDTKLGDRPVRVLVATGKEGSIDRYLLDAKSGLLLGQQSTVPAESGTVEVELMFEDYRKVDGLNLPHRVRLTKPAEIGFSLEITEMRHNMELADTEFAKPK